MRVGGYDNSQKGLSFFPCIALVPVCITNVLRYVIWRQDSTVSFTIILPSRQEPIVWLRADLAYKITYVVDVVIFIKVFIVVLFGQRFLLTEGFFS